MKKPKFKIVFLAFLLLNIFACDSYLDESPDNRQTLKTLEDLKELLVSAYSPAAYNFIEWKTDNAVAIDDNIQRPALHENFRWEPVVSSENQDTPTYFWSHTYNAIAHSNQALVALDQVENTNDELKKAIKGEALITRAYNHFLLANIFCQHYQESTAASELGIPYITVPETVLKTSYERKSLQETYDLIEKDLLEAIPLINNSFYKGIGKYHFTTEAAYAFASRFYLFKGDYPKCVEYSNKLLGNGIADTKYVRDMESIFRGTTFDEIANKFNDIEHPANLLVVRKNTGFVTRYNRGYRANFPIFILVFSSKKIQPGNDYRFRMWNLSTNARFQPKFTELFQFTTSTTGFPYFIMTVLRGEEVIFNRMEAYVQIGNIAKALADYNAMAPFHYTDGELSLNEITSFYGGTQKEAMLQFILDERRKEFFHEGLRWWDIKRFRLSIEHTDIRGTTVKLSADDLKKAEQIPANAIANGIAPNPR